MDIINFLFSRLEIGIPLISWLLFLAIFIMIIVKYYQKDSLIHLLLSEIVNLSEKPKVGLGVMIIKDNKVLLGKRKGSHGGGEYSWPGGHLEYMESFFDCAKREISEECGIEIENLRFLKLSNLKDYSPKHYVDIGFIADWKSGEPKVLEPEKCESWGWYDIDNLPQPLFKGLNKYIESYKTNKVFWDE
jgi:8-oxo-dGTP diphosphatase